VRADTEFLILGGGVAGLAAAAELGGRAVVLEREARPGGLVRTECFDGYWFDHVLHLLHVADGEAQGRMERLLGDALAPCPPVAWVECAAGTVRYPFQLNLGGLEPDAAVRCLADYARACFEPDAGPPPVDFEALLRRTFGESMCELFFFPYNRKMWRRPLDSLAPSGFVWNVARPAFEQAVRGALEPNVDREAYNSRAFYPRPPADAPVRGMEVLSRALAGRVAHLHLGTAVEEIDPAARTATGRRGGASLRYRYSEGCLCTLPLPAAIRMCAGAPNDLRAAAAALPHNLVFTAAFSIRGPRPEAPGLWRYHADESVPFTRLVFMTELDPLTAPPEGWGVMAEITHPAEAPRPSAEQVLASARDGLRRVNALPAGCEIVAEHLLVADPAYVVFTPDSQDVVRRCREFLDSAGISTVGRYGRWEYSSMAQVMADGAAWAEARLAGAGAGAGPA
jgi:protoporphyrinogen oxidase